MESIGRLKLAEEKLENLDFLFGQVQAKACSILEFSLGWEELNNHLRTVKEDLVEREKRVGLLEKQLKEREEQLGRWSEELDSKSKCVDEKIREFEAMERGKGLLDRQIEECKLQLCDKENELASLGKELSAKGQELEGVQKSLEDSRMELQDKEAQLEARKNDLQRTEDLTKHRLEELRSKEKDLDKVQESEQKKSKELREGVSHLDSIKELIRENNEELEKKEEQYKNMTSLIERTSQKLDLAEEELSTIRGSIKESLKNLELKKDHLNSMTINIEKKTKQLQEMESQCNDAQKSIINYKSLINSKETELKSIENKRTVLLAKLELEEKRLEGLEKLAEQYEKELGKKTTELKSLEIEAEKYARDAELKEDKLGSLDISVKEKIKELELNQNTLTSVKSAINKCNDELATMEDNKKTVRKSFDECFSELKLTQNKLNLVKESVEKVHDQLKAKEAENKVLEEQENSLRRAVAKYSEERESREKELTLVKKTLEECRQKLRLTQTELFTRQVENLEDGNMLSADHLSFILKENVRVQDLVADQVSRTIKRSTDPAKLVLDTVKQFHSSILGKDRNFGLSMTRSFISLLDQFIKLSPPILPQIKQEAQKLCREWRETMMVVPEYFLEALGFLKLVAAFRLAPDFAADDITNLFGTASRHFFPLEFLSALGFPDNVYACLLSSSQVKNQKNKATEDSNAIYVTRDGTSLFTIISDGRRIMRFKYEVTEIFLGPQDPSKVVLDLFSQVGFPANGFRERFHMMVHLKQVSPKVTPQVKHASIPLAKRWKSGMTLEDENTMEAFAFLLFLIVYGVADSFVDRDILELIMMIAQIKPAPEICWSLGFANKMPDFIRVLIQKKRHMEAARFICSFGLASEFPVEPLLVRYLEKRRMEAWISNYEINSLKDVDLFVDRELEALRAISNFILEFKLDFVAIERINDEMAVLENEKISRRLRTQTPVPLVSQHAQSQQYRPGATSGFINPQAYDPWYQRDPQSLLQPHQKRPRVDAYRDTRFVPQTSDRARLFHAASDTTANSSQANDDDCVITGSSNCSPG